MINQRVCANGFRICLIAGLGLVFTACGGKFADINDDDLRDEMNRCNRIIQKSPGFAISCDNYARECESRRDEGRYVC